MTSRSNLFVVLGCALTALTLLATPVSRADTFVVNSTLDDVDATPGDGNCWTVGGRCTLRAAIQETNALAGDDTIELPAGVFYLTRAGGGEDAAATGDLDITDAAGALTIIGDHWNTTIIDGLFGDRIFHSTVGQTLTIRDMTLRNGSAIGTNGGGLLHNGAQPVTIERVRFTGNDALDGACIFQSGGDVTVTGCTFVDSTASGSGAAIAKGLNGAMTVTDSEFRSLWASGQGGAIRYSGNGDLTVGGSAFIECEAASDGGAIMLTLPAPVGLTLTNTRFDRNTSLASGGAVCYTTIGGNVGITNCLFTDCSAGTQGGAGRFSTSGGNLAISGTGVQGNTANGDGGGILFPAWAGQLTIQMSYFSDNTALGGWGGGLYSSTTSAVAMTDVDILGNDALNGGGGAVLANRASATLTRCSFEGNTSVTLNGGGGLYDSGIGALTVTDCTFADNSTSTGTSGGGMLTMAGGGIAAQNSTFARNVAGGPIADGGGIAYMTPAAGTLVNCTFSGNVAGNRGGGVYAGGILTITHCTFAENSALNGGAAVHRTGLPMVTLENTIIAAGITANNCGGLAMTSGGGNLDEDGSCALADPTDLSNVNPMLAPLASNGGLTQTHALLGGSPATDAARTAVCPAVDQRGVARPLDGNGDGTAACDIGAFEFFDCDANGLDDRAEIAQRATPDCNVNNIPDVCESPDTDGDGTADICDTCTDTDGDGFGDPGFAVNTCPEDGCPADAAKHAPGVCGCGVADADTDADGVLDCNDNCPDVANADQADSNGDGVGDACTPPPAGAPGGCGVGCGPGLVWMTPIVVGWLVAVRRRSRMRRIV